MTGESQDGITDEYLVYRIGSELYGTPLAAVEKVLQELPTRGLIDLRAKLGARIGKEPALGLALRLGRNTAVAVVDDVREVTRIEPAAVHALPPKVRRSYLPGALGVARLGGELVVLIDLAELLAKDVAALEEGSR